jgi:hypothetical protein
MTEHLNIAVKLLLLLIIKKGVSLCMDDIPKLAHIL